MNDRLADPERIRLAVRGNIIQRVLDYMEEGRPDGWIMQKLGLFPEEYFDIKRRAVRSQVDAHRKLSTEEIYAEYVIQQAACIRDLTGLAKTSKKKNDLRALVSAVKTRSDIYDKIIRTGQDFGIIEKKAERHELGMAVILANLTNDELQERIAGALTGIKDLMVKFADKDLLELKPGKLHRRLPPLPAGKSAPSPVKPVDGTQSKTNRARANKVHAGRRVTKKPK